MLAALKLSLRRAGFGLGGAVLMLIGLGFLTVAAWIALEEARDTQFAALVIGLGYFGLGAVVMALGTRRPRYVAPPVAAATMSLGGLSAAFAQGFGAGAATRTAMRSKG
ncbi:phage holin family protein [Pseudooceanicola sp. MF1-13]|uniref:phage holin family protein n=1 Tax=Pseudooceanicola sp. MF1-13 TaxID=3379095 RepID=UPI00389162F0